ncbi:MAG: N-acetyltransferase [Gemmatimonadota bacterium]|nr:N-acetyltransferase [Gemmatimonadota bacterium]MDH3426846.1 N-acetyltransferase [Gemmatimonadota bacterium]
MSGPGTGVRIESAWDKRTFKDFLRLPYRIYAGDPNWVAPLLRDVKTMFDRDAHPFHLHSEVEPFVAYRDGRAVGRIVAIHNRNHVAFHEEPVGFFGFFECEDRQETADALFERVAEWLRERGLETMRGPASFSTNEEAGLLIEGFDMPPAVMMPYNPARYVRLVETAGFREAKTMLALNLVLPEGAPDYLRNREEWLRKRLNITLRPINMARFEAELGLVREIYNKAWEKNWGFVPMTEAEIGHMAKELKPVLRRDPEQVILAEDLDGSPVGFALWLKDYNRALIHARGRLFPTGLLKILWHSRKIDMARVLTLGLVPEYRGKGIDSLFYMACFRFANQKGVFGGEFGWVLEDNLPMVKPLQRLGSTIHKRYRLYDRPL